MYKISEVVENIVEEDEIASVALNSKILNLSSYANKIKPLIEKTLYKPVRIGSIVTALSRLTNSKKSIPPLTVDIRIEDMAIKSPLCELTYDKNEQVVQKVSDLVSKSKNYEIFSVTNGIGEVTLIASQKLEKDIIKIVGEKPKGIYSNLGAVTVRFIEKDYINIPNMIYTLVSALAVKRINLIEIVSTFTEISFIVRALDLNQTVDIFRSKFLK